MTDRRDDHPISRDPRFDAAWASVSNEDPPPALDAAIRAAARREVDARPGAVDAPVPEATRPERWWFPLAAAATIGAIALGLLQIVGQDGVFGDGAPAVVSDMPSDAGPAARDSAAPAPKAPANVAGGPEAPPPVRGNAVTGAPDGGGVGAAPSPAPQAPAAPSPLRFVPSPAPAPAAAADAAVSSAPPIAARAAQASGEQRAGVAASAPERQRAQAARETRAAGTPLPVPEWIALIRRLRDEGRIDDAVKELSAFRRAYADHLQLLPADLAQWHPEAR